jgi:hypothetical protein
MICNDPAVSYLKDFGYSVVRLPRRDFAPRQILVGSGKALDNLGMLDTVMVAGPTLPPVKLNETSANISGQRTSDLSLGVGLNILGNVIGAMGGGKLGLDVAYKNARSVAFEFAGVLRDSIEIAALDKYLGSVDVDPAAKHIGDLLDSDDVYVVTAVIKSAKFSVSAKREDGASLAVDVPTIQQVVGGNVKLSGNASAGGAVTFEGSEPLVFGFQAVRLYYDEGHYTAFEPVPHLLVTPGAFVGLHRAQ